MGDPRKVPCNGRNPLTMNIGWIFLNLYKLRLLLCTLHGFQMTRVGAVVNDIRKKVASSAPELSKRCRALIKCWQKLAEPRPTSSGSSSANGTPSYASPSLRKGVTPGTPARSSRVTPVGSSHLTPGSSRVTPLASCRLTPVSSTGTFCHFHASGGAEGL